MPVAFVVVVAITDVPAAFSNCTVTPAAPDSPLLSRPSPSLSIHTVLPIVAIPPEPEPDVVTSPASTLRLASPAVSVIGPVIPVVGFALL